LSHACSPIEKWRKDGFILWEDRHGRKCKYGQSVSSGCVLQVK
jgi:hypothetical protein